MKLAALMICVLLLAASAEAFEGNDRILDVDQYQNLPPNSPYDAAVASGYVSPAALVRPVDYVPYGSQVTRTEYGTGYVARPTYGYVAQPTAVVPRTYGYVAQPTTGYVAQPTYGYVAQPTYGYVAEPIYGYVAQPTFVVPRTYGYVAQPTYGYVETRTYGYAVPRTTGYVVPRSTAYVAPRVYGYTSAPRVYEPRRYYRQDRAGAPAAR